MQSETKKSNKKVDELNILKDVLVHKISISAEEKKQKVWNG